MQIKNIKGIGEITELRLNSMGIYTISDLQAISPKYMLDIDGLGLTKIISIYKAIGFPLNKEQINHLKEIQNNKENNLYDYDVTYEKKNGSSVSKHFSNPQEAIKHFDKLLDKSVVSYLETNNPNVSNDVLTNNHSLRNAIHMSDYKDVRPIQYQRWLDNDRL